jgi:hypothetical protein
MIAGPHSRITHEQYFLLCEAMRNHQEVLTNQKMNLATTARWLAEKLGFVVTPDHVAKAMRQTGVTWEIPIRRDAATRQKLIPQLVEQVQNLQAIVDAQGQTIANLGNLRPDCICDQQAEEIREIKAELAVMRGLVHRLYQGLGLDAPGYTVPPRDRNGMSASPHRVGG